MKEQTNKKLYTPRHKCRGIKKDQSVYLFFYMSIFKDKGLTKIRHDNEYLISTRLLEKFFLCNEMTP